MLPKLPSSSSLHKVYWTGIHSFYTPGYDCIVHTYVYMARLLGVRGAKVYWTRIRPYYTLGFPLYMYDCNYGIVHMYIYMARLLQGPCPPCCIIGGVPVAPFPGSYSTVPRKHVMYALNTSRGAWSTITYTMLLRKCQGQRS